MQEKELECLQGTVKKITYRNEVNCYTVAEVKCGKDIHIAVGIMPFLAEGDVAEFYGNFTVHASYGKQFSVDRPWALPPTGQSRHNLRRRIGRPRQR